MAGTYDYQSEAGNTPDGEDLSSVGAPTAQGTAQDETMHPALKAFAAALPEDISQVGEPSENAKKGVDGEQVGWLTRVMTRINDWVTGRDLADRAQAHSEEYVKNLDTFKQGLLNMVKADPTAVTVARDVIPDTIRHLISSNLPDDAHAKAMGEIGSHIQNEVVEAAVQSMALKSPVLAQRMLDSTVGNILSADQKQSLTATIHAQTIAQQADANAQGQQAQGDQQRALAAAGHRYGEQLVNPGTGDFAAPAGWASKLIADGSVHPEEKGSLMGAYGRLQQGGDVAESNGHTVLDALRSMKNGSLQSPDIWNSVGTGLNGLSMKDATWLNGLMHSETPEGRANRDAFTNALEDAAKQLMGPSGQMGAQGARNFNNYAKWLIGAYQQTGTAGLDPNHDGYLFKNVGMNQFKDPQIVNNGVLQGSAQKQPIASYFRNPRGAGRSPRRR
jgi:hypothetical protein